MVRTLIIVVSGLIIISVISVTVATTLMQRQSDREARGLLQPAEDASSGVIKAADLEGIPSCVQQWLRRSGVIGKEKIHTVRLRQIGQMRSAEDKPWMPLEAVQYINVDQPGFLWRVRVKAAPGIFMTGKDKYDQGQGSMQIKVLSLLPVVNARPGKEMNQSSMLRFLAEMIWYPSAALNDYISWEAIDTNSARATMTWRGVSAAMVFSFNAQGDLVSSVAPRYQEVNGRFVLNDWGGEAREYRDFHGVRIQNKSDIIWKYQTGDFNWLRLEVTAIDFNQPDLF